MEGRINDVADPLEGDRAREGGEGGVVIPAFEVCRLNHSPLLSLR